MEFLLIIMTISLNQTKMLNISFIFTNVTTYGSNKNGKLAMSFFNSPYSTSLIYILHSTVSVCRF